MWWFLPGLSTRFALPYRLAAKPSLKAAMPPVEIYTTPYCPYCLDAKALLKKKNVAFKEIDVSRDRALRAAMTARANGRTTVPQIFIGATHVGGCDDLYALDGSGGLDPLLQGKAGTA
jgi:glutaredoxin 3